MAQLPPHQPLPPEQPQIQYTQAAAFQASAKLSWCVDWTCCLCWTYFVLALINAIFLIIGMFGLVFYMEEYQQDCEYQQLYQGETCSSIGSILFLGVIQIVLGLTSTVMAVIFSLRGIEAQKLKSRQAALKYYKMFWIQLWVSIGIHVLDALIENFLSGSSRFYRHRTTPITSFLGIVIMVGICSCVYCCVKEFKNRVEVVASIHESVQSRHLVQGVPHIAMAVPVSEVSQQEIEMEKV